MSRAFRSLTVALVVLLAGEAIVLAQSTDKPRQLSRRERKDRIAQLHENYRSFLTLVEPIITPDETNLFLLMESDEQRDRYIEDFWKRRDPDPKTVANEFREGYMTRHEEAKNLFRNVNSDRGRIYLLHGEPLERTRLAHCRYVQPMEIWRYRKVGDLGPMVLIFHDPVDMENHRLWIPRGNLAEALRPLVALDAATYVAYSYPRCPPPDPVIAIFYGSIDCQQVVRRPLIEECPAGDQILNAVRMAEQDSAGAQLTKVFNPPAPRSEDLTSVLRTSVIANPAAPRMAGEASSGFAGRRGERTITQIGVKIPTTALKPVRTGETANYQLEVNGETLKEEKVFETFHYRFDFPAGTAVLPVMVERHLYPASYKVRLKILDTGSGSEGIFEVPVEVPRQEAGPVFAEESAAASVAKLRILPPSDDSVVIGFSKVEAVSSEVAITHVEFYMDGKKVMVKRGAPFSANLYFGPVPRPRIIRAVGLDAKGEIVDADELAVNLGLDPFRVKIVRPRSGAKASGSVRVDIEASIPEGKKLRHLEVFRDEEKVATLYQPPFVLNVPLPDPSAIVSIRAVATLEDETVAPSESMVILNAPDHLEQIQVHLIEMPVTVLKENRPVADLSQSAFRFYDENEPGKIERFEYVRNLPLSIGMAIDTSASMRPRLGQAQSAAADFLKRTLRKNDQAFLIGFDRYVHEVSDWSRDPAGLVAKLSLMRAEQTTSLYDAVIAGLYRFQGVRGQRALILLSDGRDTGSRFTYEQALEYAKRAGIPIYVIGIGISAIEIDVRPQLNALATETGGAAWFLDKETDLNAIYEQIENELRSQYMLAFYPPAGVKPGGDWREVRVAVAGAKVKTIRGYYP